MKFNIRYIFFLFLIYLIYKKIYFKDNYLEKYTQVKKAIVFIEFENHPYLKKTLEDILKYKNSDWNLILVTGNKVNINSLPENVTYININVQLKKNISNISEYNKLLKNKDFWNLIDAEHIQILNIDSGFCNDTKKLDDFLKYEYIGCSYDINKWNSKHRGSGSFSFRKKSFMIKCIESYPDLVNTDYPPEDGFYSMCLVDNKDKYGYNDPNHEEINNYCVYNTFNNDQDAPLGMNISYVKKEVKDWLDTKCNIGKHLLRR